MRSARSKTVTWWPARVSCCAAARPAGPEPTTATVFPVCCSDGSGTTQPSSKALSMISTSICLIVTASWLMPSTHDDSHGAGQSRPVNSGKLLVACSRSIASRHRSVRTRSFHSGIRLPSGQPLWQNGIPQSMHRDAWCCSVECGKSSYTSSQSRRRRSTGRRLGVSRWVYFRKPLGSGTGGRHDRFFGIGAGALGLGDRLQHPLVVARHHLGEALLLAGPVGQDPLADRGVGGIHVGLQHPV